MGILRLNDQARKKEKRKERKEGNLFLSVLL